MKRKRKTVRRYGLHLVSPRGKHSVKYVMASSPKKAEMNYYASASHFRSENSIAGRATRVPAGSKMILEKPRKRRSKK